MHSSSSSSFSSPHTASPLSESLVAEAFHSLLQDALIQAQAEGLLSQEEIRSDGEIKLIAPSLSLYFAALQAQGSPPSIASPKDQSFQLSNENCPDSFASFFRLWQGCVPKLRRLSLENRHDLALLLCEKEPASSPIMMEVVALARDFKTVALAIVQRSTFQSRFRADVETAMEWSMKSSSSSGSHYIAPPSGHPSEPVLNPQNLSKAMPPAPPPPPPPRKTGSRDSTYRPLPPPPLPTIAIEPPEEEETTLMLIRETLFAALADSLATNQALLSLLQRNGDKSWSSRCYFASLSLAILDVCLFRVHLPTLPDMNHISSGIRRSSFPWNEAFVKTVYTSTGQDKVSLENCPMQLQKLLYSLFRIGMFVQSLSESDDRKAIEDAGQGRETEEVRLYIHRLKNMLLGEVSPHASQQAADEQGDEYVKEANVMLNRLALAMFEIPSFRQRQTEAFVILGAIRSV